MKIFPPERKARRLAADGHDVRLGQHAHDAVLLLRVDAMRSN